MSAAFVRGVAVVCVFAWGVAACAAPPLTLYSLGGATVGSETSQSASQLGVRPTVIEIVRVTVPDELDTQDIVVRDGSTLRRSVLGRWASRLSLGITDRLTGRLAARRPDALVTDRPQAEAPTYRVMINVNRLDVATGGAATLEADWLIVPNDRALPTRRDRTQFGLTGPVATDQDVVTLEETLLDKLADAIDISELR